MKEICICAAIRSKNRKHIIRCHRHSDGIHKSQVVIPALDKPIMQIQQGFMTSNNRFVSRYLGARLQNKAGIVSLRTGNKIRKYLFSEDLY